MTDVNWQPAGTPEALQQRAAALTSARKFFEQRNVLEVETPILSSFGVTDPHIGSMPVHSATGEQFWLRSSPEYHMKRLLASGAPDIYQIAKVFRDAERGAKHQPEFTMIEWYRLGFNLEQMIAETCALLIDLSGLCSKPVSNFIRIDYADAFQNACGINPLNVTIDELRITAKQHLAGQADDSLIYSLGNDRNAWLDLLASHLVYPSLPKELLVSVENYPATQAMLARLNPANPDTALRFEVFLNGTELANGFHELCDAQEQANRFAQDQSQRQAAGLADMQSDIYLLAALQAGLPDCSGVAVGLDRLLMACNCQTKLDASLSFIPGY